jgi:hypothetical protein
MAHRGRACLEPQTVVEMAEDVPGARAGLFSTCVQYLFNLCAVLRTPYKYNTRWFPRIRCSLVVGATRWPRKAKFLSIYSSIRGIPC